MRALYAFLAGMWILIIAGGGIAVLVLGPLDVGNRGANEAIQAASALGMVAAWIFVLTRLKRYAFGRSFGRS